MWRPSCSAEGVDGAALWGRLGSPSVSLPRPVPKRGTEMPAQHFSQRRYPNSQKVETPTRPPAETWVKRACRVCAMGCFRHENTCSPAKQETQQRGAQRQVEHKSRVWRDSVPTGHLGRRPCGPQRAWAQHAGRMGSDCCWTEVCFWGEENVADLDCGHGRTPADTVRTTEWQPYAGEWFGVGMTSHHRCLK